MTKVEVNSNECIGCGVCVSICDSIFKFNDDGKSEIIKQPQTEEEINCINDVVDACPVGAIKIIE